MAGKAITVELPTSFGRGSAKQHGALGISSPEEAA